MHAISISTSRMRSWFIVLLYVASFVLGTNLEDEALEVKSQYRNLFNTLKQSNFSTFEIVKILRNKLGNTSSLSHLSLYNQCLDGLFEYSQGVLKEEFWALTMLDASSKFPPGILLGHWTELGSYEECLNVEVSGASGQFTGQHCMVNLKVDLNLTYDDFAVELSKRSGFTFSMCLPSTCSFQLMSRGFSLLGDDINRLLYEHNSNVTVWFTVDDTSCHIQQPLKWNTPDIVGVFFTLLMVLTVVVFNIFDFLIQRNYFQRVSLKRRQYIRAFSFASNWKILINTKTTDDTIPVLYGLKFLSIVWVGFASRIKFSIRSPIMGLNILNIAQYFKKVMSMIVLNASLAGDVFYLISGILNTYTYFDSTRQKNKHFLGHLKRYFKRYLRLTPAYATMVMVTSTWLYRVGDGPMWDQTMKPQRNNCAKFWWTNLLYINNYYDPVDCCMMQSWYIATEMQLFWMSPLLMYPLWRWPRAGLINAVVVTSISILIPFVVAYVYQIRTPFPLTLNKQRERLEEAVFFVPTHTRTNSYVMGLLCGYGLHLIKRKGISWKIKWFESWLIWMIAILSMSWALFGGHHLFEFGTSYNRLDTSLYIALYRFCWSIGISWVILACSTVHGGIINSILSWKLWMPLGRLSYGIYLLHVSVSLYTTGVLREIQYFSFYKNVTVFGGEFILCVFCALVLVLFTELPVSALISLMTKPRNDDTDEELRGNGAHRQPSVVTLQDSLWPRTAILY